MRKPAQYTLLPWFGETVYLDTETTGLVPPQSRIVEISIVNDAGDVLLNTLINPETSIPYEATRIHGITDGMLQREPTLEKLEAEIIEAVAGKRVVIYNKAFDWGFLPLSVQDSIPLVECCMLRFAWHYGEWNKRYGNFKWQNLTKATKYIKYEWQGDAHRALADTLACRAVWHYLDEKEET